jgi:hypothetical protein
MNKKSLDMNFKTLTQEQYDSANLKDLNGIFITTSSINLIYMQGRYSQWGRNAIIYLKDGVLHNDHGPAIIHTDDFNKHSCASYFKNGYCHRLNGPASIRYNKEFIWDGSSFVIPNDAEIFSFEYRSQDIQHNLIGPAVFDLHDKTQKKYFIEVVQLKQADFKKDPRVIVEKIKHQVRLKMNETFCRT